jgi:hypothetical protein
MDEKFELDDPETLLSMILSDKIEIITADVEGIANFSANNESLETDKQSPVISSKMLDVTCLCFIAMLILILLF